MDHAAKVSMKLVQTEATLMEIQDMITISNSRNKMVNIQEDKLLPWTKTTQVCP